MDESQEYSAIGQMRRWKRKATQWHMKALKWRVQRDSARQELDEIRERYAMVARSLESERAAANSLEKERAHYKRDVQQAIAEAAQSGEMVDRLRVVLRARTGSADAEMIAFDPIRWAEFGASGRPEGEGP